MLPENAQTRPTLIRCCDGSAFWIISRSVSDYLLNKQFLRFFLLAILIFAILAEPTRNNTMSTAENVLMWVGITIVVLSWLSVAVRLSKAMVDIGLLTAIYTPFLIFPISFITDAVSQAFIIALNASASDTFQINLTNFITGFFAMICFDIFHSRFVAPRHPLAARADTADFDRPNVQTQPVPKAAPAEAVDSRLGPYAGQPAGANKTVPPALDPAVASAIDKPVIKTVTIGTAQFAPRSIKVIRSEEHYLSIETDTETKLLRGKLSDAVAALEVSLGIQINRSFWIAYAEIADIERTDGKLRLTLRNGEVLSVPRAQNGVPGLLQALYEEGRRVTFQQLRHASQSCF